MSGSAAIADPHTIHIFRKPATQAEPEPVAGEGAGESAPDGEEAGGGD